MPMQQRKRSTRPSGNRDAASSTAPLPVRQEYTAAVRYLDGRPDIFHVRNADDIADARAMVLAELGNLRSLLISPRR